MQEVSISLAMVAVGAVGLRRLSLQGAELASLYLDARIWLEDSYSRLTSANRAPSRAALDDVVTLTKEGVEWTTPGGDVLRAISPSTDYPTDAANVAQFRPSSCPFVDVVYVNSEGKELDLELDLRLWYTRANQGLPKFTREEVMHLLRRSGSSAHYTPEYTLICTTANMDQVTLTQDQVFWTGPRAANTDDDTDDDDDSDDDSDDDAEQPKKRARDDDGDDDHAPKKRSALEVEKIAEIEEMIAVEPEPEPEREIEPEIEPEPEPEIEPEAEIESEIEVDDFEIEAEVEAEIEVEVEPEAEVEPEVDDFEIAVEEEEEEDD